MAQSYQIKPIRPESLVREKARHIPEGVIGAFNQLIAENYRDGSAKVRQPDLVKLFVNYQIDPVEATKRGWLNIEDLYRDSGWKVTYQAHSHVDDDWGCPVWIFEPDTTIPGVH